MSDLLDYLFTVDSTAEGTHWFTNNHITTVKLCRGSAIFSCDFGTRVFFFYGRCGGLSVGFVV